MVYGPPVHGDFDPSTGAYNLSARTLPRFRAAKARALAGSGKLHISALGDSTTMQATYTDPAYVQGWPARMRDHLIRTLGLTSGGTGIVGLWDLFGGWDFTYSPVFPYLTWNKTADGGDLQKASGQGIYGYNGVAVFSGSVGPFTSVQVNPVTGQLVDEFWVYLLTGGSRTYVNVSDGTTAHNFEIAAYVGEVFTATAGYTKVDCEPNYPTSTNPPVAGGVRVARLIVPAQDNWTAKVRSAPGAASYATMVEARHSTGNLRVSNLAQGGVSLSAMAAPGIQDAAGNGGFSQAFDVPKADLSIIALGLNDWQGTETPASFKANLTSAVQRQRSSGGVHAGGDVLLAIQPQPDYSVSVSGHTPPTILTDFWHATYEVADEQGVALIDQSYRWVDYTTSLAMYRTSDPIHPNEIGHADLGVAVGSALAHV